MRKTNKKTFFLTVHKYKNNKKTSDIYLLVPSNFTLEAGVYYAFDND